MVVWLVGLSGSGKSSIGDKLYKRIKLEAPNTVLVDGDEVRAVFAHDKDNEAYSIQGRRKNAERIVSLCQWLDSQSINVVCCVLSIFPDITDKNKSIFDKYCEVFVDVPLATLIERDNKGLYQPAIRGETKNVVGIDIPYVSPNTPDLVINNSYDAEDIPKYVDTIIQTMKNMNDALPLHR